jgi:hypothetical protein
MATISAGVVSLDRGMGDVETGGGATGGVEPRAGIGGAETVDDPLSLSPELASALSSPAADLSGIPVGGVDPAGRPGIGGLLGTLGFTASATGAGVNPGVEPGPAKGTVGMGGRLTAMGGADFFVSKGAIDIRGFSDGLSGAAVIAPGIGGVVAGGVGSGPAGVGRIEVDGGAGWLEAGGGTGGIDPPDGADSAGLAARRTFSLTFSGAAPGVSVGVELVPVSGMAAEAAGGFTGMGGADLRVSNGEIDIRGFDGGWPGAVAGVLEAGGLSSGSVAAGPAGGAG